MSSKIEFLSNNKNGSYIKNIDLSLERSIIPALQESRDNS